MKIVPVIAVTLVLGACGSDEPAPPAADAVPQNALADKAPTFGKEVADEFNDSIDRARNVEAEAMEQKRRIDEALKESGGDP